MVESQQFDSVWDAVEDSRGKAENMKLRSELMILIHQYVEALGLSQQEASKRLGITQPRLSDLMRGRIDKFSLDKLVNILASAGKHVEIRVVDDAA